MTCDDVGFSRWAVGHGVLLPPPLAFAQVAVNTYGCEHLVLKHWQDHRESLFSPLIFPKSKLNVYPKGANSYEEHC